MNIELKSFSTEEKIINQMKRNQYYLSFIDKTNYIICFINDSKNSYYLDEKEFLIEILNGQMYFFDRDIDDLFDSTNYLISPFNKTKEFIDDKYFFNNQQE